MTNFANFYENARHRLDNSFDEFLAYLKPTISTEYKYRFVSGSQSFPLMRKFFNWHQNRQDEQPPSGSDAEIRAAIYSLNTTDKKLLAFIHVSNVVCFELTTVAKECLLRGSITTLLITLRSLMERIAHANLLLEKLLKIQTPDKRNKDSDEDFLLKTEENIVSFLYGTRIDWSKISKVDFRKAQKKDYLYIKEELKHDFSALQILNSIDFIDKKIKGSRCCYELLCEYLHPNVGDLMGATTSGEAFSDKHGTEHRIRKISEGKKNLDKFPEQTLIYVQIIGIIIEIIYFYRSIDENTRAHAKLIQPLCRNRAHKIYKAQSHLFGKNDLCPCLSGLTVKQCFRKAKTVGRI